MRSKNQPRDEGTGSKQEKPVSLNPLRIDEARSLLKVKMPEGKAKKAQSRERRKRNI